MIDHYYSWQCSPLIIMDPDMVDEWDDYMNKNERSNDQYAWVQRWEDR